MAQVYPQSQPGYAPQTGYATQPGYGSQQPGYGQVPQPGYAPQNTYPASPQQQIQQAGYPPVQPGYGLPPGGVAQQPGYGGPSLQQRPRGRQSVQWMPPPQGPPGCPPGLEYLTQIDQLLIHQQVEILELFTNIETANKYAVKNTLGQQVYFAAEDNDCCTLQCCGPARPFELRILDNSQREVIHLSRPYRCSSCCCPCFLQELTVESPPGNTVGFVKQSWSLFTPAFDITDAAGNTVLTIEGPCCPCSCMGDVEFEVKSKDGATKVGRITKQWSGLLKEAFTDADNFGITFPMDLDVKVKATLLGAVFLIDFMYFEEANNNNKDHHGARLHVHHDV